MRCLLAKLNDYLNGVIGGTKMAQKYGQYEEAENALGFSTSGRPYSIVVYTSLGYAGREWMGELNALIWDYFAQVEQEEQPQEPEKTPEPVTSAEPKTEMGKAIESIERHAYQQAVTGAAVNQATQQPGLSGGKKIWTIQVRGNEEQHKKILDYIKFVGAEYREV